MEPKEGFQYREVSDRDLNHHTEVDPHRRLAWLSQVILGGQDGLVNVLGVILGVAAATQETSIVLAAGLAAAFAESVAMAGVAYTSSRAERDRYLSERQREMRHIRDVPELERQEVVEIYRRKGFSGELLDRIVDTITADREVWVAVMMTEEHRFVESDARHPVRAAVIVGLAALVGSLIPLAPFALFSVLVGAGVSLGISATVLFLVGWYKARVTVGRPRRSGIELALIGLASALAGFGIGSLLSVQP